MDSSLQQWPVLVITSGRRAGQMYSILTARSMLGRDDNADVLLDNDSVSRKHAVVCRSSDRVTIEDLGSRNGSWVNGTRIDHTTALEPGDVVRLGDVELQFAIFSVQPQRSGRDVGDYNFGDVGGPVNAGSGHLNYGSGQQYIAGGDIHQGNNIDVNNDYDPWDEIWQGQGPGRVLMAVGGIVALFGFAMWMMFIFSGGNVGSGSPFDRQIAGLPAAGVAFGLFLGGGVLAGIGSGMSKAARKRESRRRTHE